MLPFPIESLMTNAHTEDTCLSRPLHGHALNRKHMSYEHVIISTFYSFLDKADQINTAVFLPYWALSIIVPYVLLRQSLPSGKCCCHNQSPRCEWQRSRVSQILWSLYMWKCQSRTGKLITLVNPRCTKVTVDNCLRKGFYHCK